MRKIPVPELTIGALAILLAVGVYWFAHRDEGALETSKQIGDTVVTALEQHRAEQGRYPDSLAALVPAYLDSVPRPVWGMGEWRYRRYTAAEAATADTPTAAAPGDRPAEYFQLSVPREPSGYPLLFYDLTLGQWVLNN